MSMPEETTFLIWILFHRTENEKRIIQRMDGPNEMSRKKRNHQKGRLNGFFYIFFVLFSCWLRGWTFSHVEIATTIFKEYFFNLLLDHVRADGGSVCLAAPVCLNEEKKTIQHWLCNRKLNLVKRHQATYHMHTLKCTFFMSSPSTSSSIQVNCYIPMAKTVLLFSGQFQHLYIRRKKTKKEAKKNNRKNKCVDCLTERDEMKCARDKAVCDAHNLSSRKRKLLIVFVFWLFVGHLHSFWLSCISVLSCRPQFHIFFGCCSHFWQSIN